MNPFEKILSELPSLRHIVDNYGHASVFDYANAHYKVHLNEDALFLERQTEFLSFLENYVSGKFGNDISQKVQKSLKENYAVSTAEHHGPLGHPFFFQSTILRGLIQNETIVNFCTSHVSLGNSSYPRGFVFHGDGNRAPDNYLHLPLFPARERMTAVFEHPSFKTENIHRLTSRLSDYRKNNYITEVMYEKIQYFLEKYLLNEQVLHCKNYSEQITLLNTIFWRDLFPESPEYVALDAEDVLCDLLLLHLEKNTTISDLITNIELQPVIEKYFDTISCCFNLTEKTGTYLFWHQDKQGVRRSLWRKGNELVSIDGSIHIKISKEEIAPQLKERLIIPSGLLIYSVLSCYSGLTCLGGFAQGNYLPKIQSAYRETLAPGESSLSSQGSILNEDMAFLFDEKMHILTALDVFLKGLPPPQEIEKYAKNTTVRTSIKMLSPEIARCL